MPKTGLGLVLALALATSSPSAAAPQAATDADVVKGIQQVDDGDYDTAILTLDAAVRRLSADPAKARELSEAYLYLGIAYLGKGHDGAAKAKFREAIKQIHDLSLSPEKYPPTGQTQSSLSYPVTPQAYIITVKLGSANTANYTLTVRYP